ncbi:alpha-L-rhamnosidase C-terminal domain-containing protein [Streptomyces sp. NPDC001978]|uniref:alpha-L-rhamnosidase-related protein n=1 Tax=Streptomyces sp. NPDC001978 TaxID=3364627 RepID=UPI00369A49A4
MVELIRCADTHAGTGFLTTGDLLPVLADNGYAQVAYELLVPRTEPSWMYMLDHGATTIWEDWQGVDENGDAHESLNHYSKGAVIRFLRTHTLGLRQAPGSVAWESFEVASVPHPSLTWARGSYAPPQGRIEVGWQADGDDIRISVTASHSTVAKVVFPDGTTETVTDGSYRASRPWCPPGRGRRR